MLRTISGTFASKLFLALLNFATIILTARILGPEGRGEISYFVANMVLVSLFTSLIGGPSLVYLTPRHNFFQFLLPSYAWAVLLAFVFCEVFFYEQQLQSKDYYFLLLAIILNSWKSVNQMVLLGKEKMKAFNWLALSHSILLILVFLSFGWISKQVKVENFYWGIILSNFLIWLWSILLLWKTKENMVLWPSLKVLKQMTSYGGMAQLANIIQFANYRISYFYLMNMHHKSGAVELGKYSVAVSIAESVWIIGQSLATVQFSKLSNTIDAYVSRKISMRMFKFNVLMNFMAVIVLVMLPSGLFQWLFGSDAFGQVVYYIRWLAPGIFMLGISTSLSAYFGGKGKYGPAIGSSIMGALVTWCVCHWYIEEWGAIAASIAASLSYTIIAVYFIICFVKEERLSFNQIVPSFSTLILYYRWIRFKIG